METSVKDENKISSIGNDRKDRKSMRESKTIECKETIANTFLKTVSAFSNYDGGTIHKKRRSEAIFI